MPSIAIIPLENLSADSEQEYFSDGMTDALFTDLAKIHGLSVISRTSVMRYKRTKKPVPEIARDLKVDYVVEGTVTRSGDVVRISAQLIAVRSDPARVGGKLRAVRSRRSEPAKGNCAGHRRTGPHSRHTPGTGADGRAHDEPGGSGSLPEGQVQLANPGYRADAAEPGVLRPGDPQGTRLRPGIRRTGRRLQRAELRLDRKDYHARGCEAVHKALELDDNLGEAHASMDGCLDLWDWQQRERHLRPAVELSPSYPTAHQWLGAVLIDTGQGKEGLLEVRRAVELDPLGPSPNNALCMSFYMTRQYDRAIQHCLQTLEVFPGYLEPYYGR